MLQWESWCWSMCFHSESITATSTSLHEVLTPFDLKIEAHRLDLFFQLSDGPFRRMRLAVMFWRLLQHHRVRHKLLQFSRKRHCRRFAITSNSSSEELFNGSFCFLEQIVTSRLPAPPARRPSPATWHQHRQLTQVYFWKS